MAWLLDTNAWISFLKPGQPSGRAIADRLGVLRENEILLCSVVKAELWHGAEKYANQAVRLARQAEIFERYSSRPFDDAFAQHYAAIRHELELRGSVIGPNDLMIAAICLAHDLTLVSSKTKEFSRVTGLRVEDWSQP